MRVLLLTALLFMTPLSFGKSDEKESIEFLANTICSRTSLAFHTGALKPYEVFEATILDYLGISTNIPNYRNQITEFWNEHSERMICTEELDDLPYPQHLLKRIVELDAIPEFYFEYFLMDRSRKINFIEMVNGKPETLLDYIDKTLLKPNADKIYNVDEIKQLRGFITKMMDAKHAKDLVKE